MIGHEYVHVNINVKILVVDIYIYSYIYIYGHKMLDMQVVPNEIISYRRIVTSEITSHADVENIDENIDESVV